MLISFCGNPSHCVVMLKGVISKCKINLLWGPLGWCDVSVYLWVN